MTSAVSATPVGVQHPRIELVPPFASTSGDEAIELAHMAGLHLDPWEQHVLRASLGERPDGQWSAFQIGLCVARQNGKGAIIEARELAGLFLLGERLIIHSAHEFATSLEAFGRLLFLIENTPEFNDRVKRISRSHGEEGIELKNGQRIRFRTRTGGGGRGFSCDLLILDEAMYIPEAMHGALLPTLSARPNPQVWYTGSAVDQETHDHGVVFARMRSNALKAEPGIMYMEWSADYDLDGMEQAAQDEKAWAAANPGLGIRITPDHIRLERAGMDSRTFAVERLGIGDWPSLEPGAGGGLDYEQWSKLQDPASQLTGDLIFALDVRMDRSSSSIAVCGLNGNGFHHVEVAKRMNGTDWVVPEAKRLAEEHNAEFVVDAKGPAASLIPELEQAQVRVKVTNSSELAQACGVMFDAVEQGTVRHIGQQALNTAVKGVVRRPLGEAWAWSRKASAVDVAPLVACTLCLWSSVTRAKAQPPMVAWA